MQDREAPMLIAMRLLAAPLAAVCLTASVQAADLSVVGTGDGIDLLRALGAAYTADHPDTNVIVPPSIGSGGGIAAVSSNKEVLARAARPLSDSEKEVGLIATPVFRLPSAFFVHSSAGVKSLSAGQLADVYSGKVTDWKDLAITEKSKTAVTTQDCINTVKETAGAIGFGPFTKALEMELSVLRIDGHYPTDLTYPSAVTLTFVHKEATVTPDAKQFIAYAKTGKAKTVLTTM